MFKILSFLLLFPVIVHAQMPRVLRVFGNVQYQNTHLPVMKGDTIRESNRSFIYSSPSDALFFIVPGKGIATLKPGEKSSQGQQHGELLAYMEELLPASKQHRLSGRGLLLTMEELQKHLENLSADSSPLLVLDEFRIEVGNALVPKGSDDFFYVQHIFDGEKINKRLSLTKDEEHRNFIVLDTNLLKIDGAAFGGNELRDAHLYYYDGQQKTSRILWAHDLLMVRLADIQPEICMIRKSGNAGWMQQATDYLRLAYGITDNEQIEWSLRNLECR
jgi:hypothetical protein